MSEPNKTFNFHTDMHLIGPELEMDAHQKHVEGLADLAGMEVTVKKAPSNDGAVIARFSAHFDTGRPIDAVLMATGMFSPTQDTPNLEVTSIHVSR